VGRTANGKVEARQLESPVDAETINGNIDIETSEPVHARASIDAHRRSTVRSTPLEAIARPTTTG